jgi:hypothetical protein
MKGMGSDEFKRGRRGTTHDESVQPNPFNFPPSKLEITRLDWDIAGERRIVRSIFWTQTY